MLYTLAKNQQNFTELKIQDLIYHRALEFSEYNNLNLLDLEIEDGLDCEGTLYIAYHHKKYGLVGSARLIPKQHMPSSMLSLFPPTETQSYYLVDCIFYPPKNSPLLHYPDHIMEAKYEHLYKSFYSSVTYYLENLIIQNNDAVIFFYLNEEELDCLQQETERSYEVIEQLITPADEASRYIGFIDMNDLIDEEWRLSEI